MGQGREEQLEQKDIHDCENRNLKYFSVEKL